MTTSDELAHIPERWRALVEFAIREGWQVRCSANGRITLTKPGCATLYTGAAARDDESKRTTRPSRGKHHG